MVRKLIEKIIGDNRLWRLKKYLYRHGMRPKPESVWYSRILDKVYKSSKYRKEN